MCVCVANELDCFSTSSNRTIVYSTRASAELELLVSKAADILMSKATSPRRHYCPSDTMALVETHLR